MFELDEERAKKAYEQLLKFLDFSSRSEKELVEKLYKKGYHKNEVDFAIEKAKKYNFINDNEYAKTFIEYNKTKYGRVKIEYKLVNILGIDQNIVSNLLADYYTEEEEIETCKMFAEKFIRIKSKQDDDSYKKKIGPHLFSKGFSFSVINKVLSILDIEHEDNN